MKSIRLLRILIMILLCTNLFLLFRLFNKPKHLPKLSYIVKAEGKQARLLDNEMNLHRKKVLKMEKKMFRLRQDLANTKPSECAQREGLLSKIASYQREIDSITIIHFDRVSELCTTAQKQYFKKFRLRILNPHPNR